MIFTPPRLCAVGVCLFCKNFMLRDVEDVVPYKKSEVSRVFSLLKTQEYSRERCKTTFVGGDVLDAPRLTNSIQTKPLSVILSEVKLLRVERKRTSKSARQSRRGISFEISVAFHRKCYIPVASHQNSFRDPCGASAPCFHLVLHSVKVRLRSG